MFHETTVAELCEILDMWNSVCIFIDFRMIMVSWNKSFTFHKIYFMWIVSSVWPVLLYYNNNTIKEFLIEHTCK